MAVIDNLSSSFGRRDEAPNQELAKQIADKNDKKAVQELIEGLGNKSKDIQSDCIKVIYEIAERKPALIAGYAKDLIALLDNKNNRLQWGAMTAIDAITLENPKVVYAAVTKILLAAGKGSVISKDHAVNILIKFCSIQLYAVKSFALLVEQLLSSPTNQLPMYAERAVPIINEKNKDVFVKTLTSRLPEVETDSKRKRIEKVIKKL